MQITVNHITRMRTDSRICIAGVNTETLSHVRPVTPPDDLITRELLQENGGPLAIGAVVDLGAVTPQPNPPETEDHRFKTSSARLIEMSSPESYWRMLCDIAAPSLETAFGPNLEARGRGFAIEPGRGVRSLAVVKVTGQPQLRIDDWEKLRLHLDGAMSAAALSVADVRFVAPDHVTVKTKVVDSVNARLRQGVPAYAMLGLSRPFHANTDDRPRHWVQVNGLCLADSPISQSP